MAPEYHQLMVGLGSAFNRSGHKTFYAIDSPQNLYRFPENPPEGEYRVFSKFRSNFNSTGQAGTFTWKDFFPDFDRYEHYGVNWGRKQDWYFNLAESLSAFFEMCVKDWKIDIVVYEGVNNSFAHFACIAARRNGATYIGVESSRIPGRYELKGASENETRHKVLEYYNYLIEGGQITNEIDQLVTKYLDEFDNATPDYMTANGLLLENPITKYLKVANIRKLMRTLSYQLIRRSDSDLNYRSGPPLSYSIIHLTRNTGRWLRSFFVSKYFTPPGEEDEYYLYTIHFHPEASTSVLARWYVDEYPVIKNIAFSLPPGKWLYVKDHLSAVGYPPLSFYHAISNLPNVKLISPCAHTKTLIRKSQGVITQTGTAGYEALVLGKPVWLLGQVFYDFHPGCYKASWNDDLEASFITPPQPPINTLQSRMLATAYFMHTKPGELPLQGETSKTATFDNISREIINSVQHT